MLVSYLAYQRVDFIAINTVAESLGYVASLLSYGKPFGQCSLRSIVCKKHHSIDN